MAPIHRQFIPEPQSRAASQRKQLPVSPYGSLCACISKDYTSVKMLLNTLKYDDYGWEVIRYLKMVSFLMGLQGDFTKFLCFLCLNHGSRSLQKCRGDKNIFPLN